MKIQALILAALRGAVEGVREQYRRPAAPGVWGFIKKDMRLYFAPATGAAKGVIAGVKKELARGGKR